MPAAAFQRPVAPAAPAVVAPRVGDKLWFAHASKVWALGFVVAVTPGPLLPLGEVSIVEDGTGILFTVSMSRTHPCDPSHLENAPDLASLSNLHEGPLLAQLERRFFAGAIYTFTGECLISVNPYHLIPGLYSIPPLGAPLRDYAALGEPHVYAVAERAYKAMLAGGGRSQALIVSGESGAGKTEACKCMLQYLAGLSLRQAQRVEGGGGGGGGGGGKTPIELRVLQCNPILEAFGNAKTVRNDNSSRFGKFLRVTFDPNGAVCGARLTHYLLEKARVVRPAAGERNYHVFYQLSRGASEEERQELLMGSAGDFSYLAAPGAGDATVIPPLDDGEEFRVTRQALTAIGVGEEAQAALWRTVAGIMHLGNVQFTRAGEGGGEEACAAEPFSATTAAKLLGCPDLATKLVKRLMRVKGRSSVYSVSLTERQALGARDALAKFLYARLFQWLVARCNQRLAPAGGSAEALGYIGILDIFGFEIFESNSFEQLCASSSNRAVQLSAPPA